MVRSYEDFTSIKLYDSILRFAAFGTEVNKTTRSNRSTIRDAK